MINLNLYRSVCIQIQSKYFCSGRKGKHSFENPINLQFQSRNGIFTICTMTEIPVWCLKSCLFLPSVVSLMLISFTFYPDHSQKLIQLNHKASQYESTLTFFNLHKTWCYFRSKQFNIKQ